MQQSTDEQGTMQSHANPMPRTRSPITRLTHSARHCAAGVARSWALPSAGASRASGKQISARSRVQTSPQSACASRSAGEQAPGTRRRTSRASVLACLRLRRRRADDGVRQPETLRVRGRHPFPQGPRFDRHAPAIVHLRDEANFSSSTGRRKGRKAGLHSRTSARARARPSRVMPWGSLAGGLKLMGK